MINIHHELGELAHTRVCVLGADTIEKGRSKQSRSCPGGGLYRHQALPRLADAARLVLQVHDELVFEVREECLPRVAALVKRCMEQAVVLPNVPLQVKMLVGAAWDSLDPYEL